MFSNIFQRFMEKSPVPVMVQVLLELVLNPDKLEALFERATVEQYTRTLLFSTVFDLMNLVIFKTFPSVHAAYREQGEQIGVSITSVYNKLNGIGANTSALLVRDTASEKAEIIEALGGRRAAWLAGYRIKMLDGNCIEATEHRLQVLRETKAGALPGKSLVVYDPELELEKLRVAIEAGVRGRLPADSLTRAALSNANDELGNNIEAALALGTEIRHFGAAGTPVRAVSKLVRPVGNTSQSVGWGGVPPLSASKSDDQMVASGEGMPMGSAAAHSV